MERFFVPPPDMGRDEARISGGELKHLKNVLRLKAGAQVEVFDGLGKGFAGILVEVGTTEALVSLTAPVEEPRESPLRICLAQGMPKGERMDWIVQKATELGVETVIPLELSRCVVRLDGERKRTDKQARWQKIALEAAKQCGRLKLPDVLAPMGLTTFLQRIRPEDMLLIPWEEGGQPLRDFLWGTGSPDGAKARVYVMIGPEGGITEEEIESARKAGGQTLTLGPRILRTDTAGLMLLSVLQYQWGDMG
ncbi:MAG: 16S rRNA (uracil(1498)-N(3))-methyltransferase [Clostridiales bacterium]|nr:16S rRNA (uracil(1498)-N(3))-methyltransferase [Clostridiales bacterium]